jgi:predicted O-linked N-acetylglucosamine transferase (SPINDLY family)
MTWSPEAEELLINQEYDQLVDFYENLIAENPEEISNYWYLGLAYLFQGREEEAQLTWLMVLNEIENQEEIEILSQELAQILDTEAQRQEDNKNYQIAWLIRVNIREFQPENLTNLISLIWLDATLKYLNSTKLRDWKVMELLLAKRTPKIPEDLMLKALDKVLYIISEESVDFARACLEYSEGSSLIIEAICKVAKRLNLVDKLILYPVDLINICREKQPDDLVLLKILFIFYSDDFQYYEKAREVATEFLTKSNTLTARIFGLRQLLYLYLRNYNWKEGIAISEQYIQAMIQLANEGTSYMEGFISSVIPMLPNQLLYLQDNPRLNRSIFNQFNKNFQTITIRQGILGFQYQDYGNSLTNHRPLRIGYIGHTFRSHSVGWLCRWLINYHDLNNFEIFIYSLTNHTDQLTEEWFIKKTKNFYRYSPDTYPENIIQQIRDDLIDILIDVDSITLLSTCEVIIHKPAPIQVTWLGMDASGIPAIDYFIADPYVLPANGQDYYAEKIWRLPHTYLGIDGFEVGTPTVTREDLNIEKDAIVFMNIQGSLKLHPSILRLQLRIVKNVPHSYLLVKGKDDQGFLKQLYQELATEEGVNLNQIRYLQKTPTELEHRANLKIADVVLDTYPYNGATTTLETLWMEVPIVTRVGEQFAARNSYTFMINAGITEGIAWSDEEYIQWGIKLGTDENLRKEISWKLRQSKKTSPLWNGKQFTREMEKAYQQMWKIYVNS